MYVCMYECVCICIIVGIWREKKKMNEPRQWEKLGKYILLDMDKDIKDKALGITTEINTLDWKKGIEEKALGITREL